MRCVSDVIVDGRDSGSVVFPQADLKLFFDTPLAIRAQRWLQKQHEIGAWHDMQGAIDCIKKRDLRDMNRSQDPLKIPEGAYVLQNAGDVQATLNQIVQLMVEQDLKISIREAKHSVV